MWDRVISKGIHAASVAMAIIIHPGYLLIGRQGLSKTEEKRELHKKMECREVVIIKTKGVKSTKGTNHSACFRQILSSSQYI